MNIDEFVARNAKEFEDYNCGEYNLPIYLDMDKTLCYESCYTNKDVLNATPVDRMVRRVIGWQEKEYDIHIFTARRGELFLATQKWLAQQFIYISINKILHKPLGIFVDDRAFNPTINGEQLIILPSEVKNFTARKQCLGGG